MMDNWKIQINVNDSIHEFLIDTTEILETVAVIKNLQNIFAPSNQDISNIRINYDNNHVTINTFNNP